MKKQIRILIICTVLFFLQNVMAECVVSSESCEFYKCESERMGCSKKDYLIKFGHKFCQKYLTNQEEYSVEGERFLIRVRECLQREIRNHNFVKEKQTCSQVEEFAFETHAPCYVESGFCQLGLKDRNRVIWVAKFKVFNIKVWKSFFELQKGCKAEKD